MAKAKKLPSGTWRVQVFIGKDANGKNIMKSFCAPTRKEAEKLAAEFELTGKKNLKRFTVGQALDGYMDLKRNVLSPSTMHGYGIIRRNRLQSLMTMDIHEVDSFAMQKAINEDAAKLSSKSINEAKNLIVTALKLYGVKLELNVTLPPKKPKIKNLPTPQQVIQMVRGTDIELPCLLAIWLSLRISEVRGLQFGDLKGNVLTIQRSKLRLGSDDVVREVNKTYSSTRQLVIPEYLIRLIQAVPHQHETDFIVPQHYQTITKHLKKLADEKGYELTYHDLRHINAPKRNLNRCPFILNGHLLLNGSAFIHRDDLHSSKRLFPFDVMQPESKRNTVQIHIEPAVIIYNHFADNLAVHLSAVNIHVLSRLDLRDVFTNRIELPVMRVPHILSVFDLHG